MREVYKEMCFDPEVCLGSVCHAMRTDDREVGLVATIQQSTP